MDSKIMVFFVGGGIITFMMMNKLIPYIPNKEVIPAFFYTIGFAVMWMCSKYQEEEGRETGEESK